MKGFFAEKFDSFKDSITSFGERINAYNHGQPNKTQLESALTSAVIQRRKSGTRDVPTSLNFIILRFGKIDKALGQIRKVFYEHDADGSHTIDKEEMLKCLKDLKVNLSEEEVETFYSVSDLDENGQLGLRNFIVTMALIYLLQPADKESAFGLPEVEHAFELIVDAFLFFDKDGNGSLSKDEVNKTFCSDAKEGSFPRTVAQRFAEMDYDHNGQCSFKEFLFAFVGWLGTAEDEEEMNGIM